MKYDFEQIVTSPRYPREQGPLSPFYVHVFRYTTETESGFKHRYNLVYKNGLDPRSACENRAEN